VTLTVAVALLAAGTLAFRLAGTLLRSRVEPTPAVLTLVDRAVAVLFAALVATSLLEHGHVAGVARPVGVAVAGVLAWRRVPFVVVVLAAAAVTAALRVAGVP
jgi:Branched-chain amino acid transport protein (AzlD)